MNGGDQHRFLDVLPDEFVSVVLPVRVRVLLYDVECVTVIKRRILRSIINIRQGITIYSLKWSKFSLYLLLRSLPGELTSVITSFGVNIEWTGRDSTRWVVNTLLVLRIKWLIHSSTSEISSLHRWSELFTWFLESTLYKLNLELESYIVITHRNWIIIIP